VEASCIGAFFIKHPYEGRQDNRSKTNCGLYITTTINEPLTLATHAHYQSPHENFRSIKNLDIELGETTVFIGQNNSGKTAILDAIRIALTRRWGQRGIGFTEYDIHLATETDDPEASSGMAIELRADEQASTATLFERREREHGR
jgi:hypothetical protein